jgi:hypothetical protein
MFEDVLILTKIFHCNALLTAEVRIRNHQLKWILNHKDPDFSAMLLVLKGKLNKSDDSSIVLTAEGNEAGPKTT